MAELFVGPIMDRIISTCFEYLQDHLTWHTSMKKELERIRENQPKIQAVVSSASKAHIIDQDPEFNKWIWQLRDAIDEADDLLDEFAYMEHETRLAKNKETKKVRTPLKFLWESASKIRKVGEGFFKTVLKIDSNLKRLEEVVHKLDKISAEVSTFLHLLENTKQVQQVQHLELLRAREEGSLPSSNLIGRGKDKEYIIQWLRKPSNEEDQTHISTTNLYSNISLLSVVGHGGMGKTSLLQHIYEDEMTKEFDLKMWVCVSNNFDVQEILADMLESVKRERPSLKKIDALQHSLKSEVMSKKFLLVLDDIWEEDEERDKSKWKKVLAPLAYGSLGSKILITTRMETVASMISKVIEKKMEKLTLEGLKEDECLLLLNTHAFADVNYHDDHKKLKFIARELVKKLFGSPLAAKVMGGVLNSNLDERYWTNVLKSDLGHNDIFPILKLSYIFLPKNLQNCFKFCSIFAQDHIFDKVDLVQMWIAAGFVQPFDIRGEDLEDVGERYFDLLVKKSFFDEVEFGCYKMHDLLHDMARSISAQECFRIVGDDQKLFTGVRETIRHLSIKTSNVEVLRHLGKFKNLRTLWITYDKNIQDFDDVLTEIFKETKSIRLLYIDNYRPKLIPKTIGYLIHLRYLRLYFDSLTLFPIPLCNLYHLQFIINNSFGSTLLYDDFFPRDMSNLSNLRHARFFQSFQFPGIGKLKFFQELKQFHRIGELEHMNELRILDITHLENVRDVEEACNAKLCDNWKLTNLSLNWGDKYDYVAPQCKRKMRINIPDPDLDERVLDNLQPHHDLKKLGISDYMGIRSAIWMNEPNLIKNLEVIELRGCLEWQNLPPFGQLFFLKSLSLQNMPKAKRFDNKYHGNDMCYVFQSLELLIIDRLEALEDWFGGGVKAEEGCLFPCLTDLILKDCPNLQELPYLPPKLSTLKIKNIGWKTLNCCSISKSVPLKTLVVSHCPNITYFFLAGEIGKVKIEDCPNLIYFGGHQEVGTIGNIPVSMESLQCLSSSLLTISSLKTLKVRDCPNITHIFLAGEVGRLQIDDCPNLIYFGGHQEVETIGNIPASVKSLQALPSSLSTISSVKKLFLYNIPLLKSLPDLPPSLCKLYILKLDNLDCLPTLSSLKDLCIVDVPKLRELPNLPPSLRYLGLGKLDNLDRLPTLSSLTHLYINKVPKLRELPDLPPFLCELYLENLDNIDCLPSSLPTLSSLTELHINEVPKLQELPDLPPSLCKVHLKNLDNLDCLPSCLPTLSSLKNLHISEVPKLRELPDLPPSLCKLRLCKLDNMDCLPLCLPTLSSLKELHISEVPKLQELPDLPPFLDSLRLWELDNLDCLPSCLPTLCSLTELHINEVPKLRELPDLPPFLHSLKLWELDNLDCLPSCLPTLSSLTYLNISEVPKLQELPDLPPSLCKLYLMKLDNLDCMPLCLPTLSSLIDLHISEVPKLLELPDLPPSICKLYLEKLDNLDCLSLYLPTISSLTELYITKVPKLRELPDLPPSLIIKNVILG